MSSSDITGPMLRKCFGAVYKKQTPSKILDQVLVMLATAQKDAGKTGDMDAMYYNEGIVDACDSIARMIAPLRDDHAQLFFKLQGKHYEGAL